MKFIRDNLSKIAVVASLNAVTPIPTASMAGYSQEADQSGKIFVKKIILRGASKDFEKEIKSMLAPFTGNWVTQNDIDHAVSFIKADYVRKGLTQAQIVYKFKKGALEIKVNESVK